MSVEPEVGDVIHDSTSKDRVAGKWAAEQEEPACRDGSVQINIPDSSVQSGYGPCWITLRSYCWRMTQTTG